MKFSLITQALIMLLGTASSAWAQTADTQTNILRIESKELTLSWFKQARNPVAHIQCAGSNRGSPLSDECKLFNSLGIVIVGPDLKKAKEIGSSAYISQAVQDIKYHGTWIVSFGPGQAPTVKPDFFGYKLFIDESGKLIKAVPVTKEEGFKMENPLIPGSVGLGKIEITGYDRSSLIYRSLK
jgi:hypothetical protein